MYVLVLSLSDGRFVTRWAPWLLLCWAVAVIHYFIFMNFLYSLVWLVALGLLLIAQAYHHRTAASPLQRQQGNEEFQSIRSTKHALTWAQTHPCTRRMGNSGQPDRGALSCQAPGILYSTSNCLHRRCVQHLCRLHPRARNSLSVPLLHPRCRDFLAQVR